MVSYMLAMEEISKVDASISVIMSVNNSLVCYALEKYDNEEHKIKYLVPVATGKKENRLCVTQRLHRSMKEQARCKEW